MKYSVGSLGRWCSVACVPNTVQTQWHPDSEAEAPKVHYSSTGVCHPCAEAMPLYSLAFFQHRPYTHKK